MGKTNKILIFNMKPKDVQSKIEQYLPVREDEKNKLGEVFTPITLIEEMLDHLPKTVWSNHEFKWLDPANGIGNFPMLTYQRLMEGLKKWEPNKNKRSKHIIKNMLYMVEINPKNVTISKQIFGDDANICCADFLNNDEKWQKQFGTNAFDIVIGNPPFQNGNSGKTAQGGHDLYPSFFIKSFELLNRNGMLLFITPTKWRAPDKKGDLKIMWDLFINNNPIFLKIYGFSETKQIFRGAAITCLDYFLLQKNNNNDYTTVIDEENVKQQIDLKEWSFLPNYNYDNIKKIITTADKGIKIIYSSSQYDKRKHYMSETKHGQYKFPVMHSHTIKDGDIKYWSNTKEPIGNNFVHMFGIPKVILIKGLYVYPYNDYKGEYAMSNYSFGIPITSKKQGDEIVNAINTEQFNNIIKSTKWSSRFTDHNMFKYFKPDFYKNFLKGDKLIRGQRRTKKLKKGGKKKTRKHNSNISIL